LAAEGHFRVDFGKIFSEKFLKKLSVVIENFIEKSFLNGSMYSAAV